MKRTLLFIACVMASLTMSAQKSSYFDYVPFVEEGKKWNVVRSAFDAGYYCNRYFLTGEKVVKDGKTYMKMYRTQDDLTVVYDAGLLREEDRKVYVFDAERQAEFLMFDYSLTAGNTYETYSSDEQKMVTYRVLSVSDFTEGPKLFHYTQETDSMTTQQRYLRKWTVCRADDNTLQKTWIEGVGSLEGPLANLYDERPISSRDYLAYVDIPSDGLFLPFSFYDTMNKQIHGCNLPTGAVTNQEDHNHQLTYELEGNRLHVYGSVFTQCGPNNYAYFIEKATDDPMMRKIYFNIQEVEPLADCMSLHATNFYVPGFDPNLNYIIVDNQGEEHPVINRTPQNEYHPFVEDGKVWKLGEIIGSPVQLVEYYYFDGDTIIGGKTCKQMMSQRYVSPDYPEYDYYSQRPSLNYVGAWYEENKQVYTYDTTNKQFRLMYDFSTNANDTLQLDNHPYYLYVVGPRKTGGIKGFKGAYREVWECGDEESIYRCAPWMEGVGIVYGPPIFNVFNVELGDPSWYLMSCTVGDEVIYLNDECEDGATPEVLNAPKTRFDFTHIVKEKPKAPKRRGEETSLYGEYSELQLGINLEPVDDAYLVRITNETGKVVYEKAINAGNIVALNIDISSYPKGRYTVTVENSYETFTGEFEPQTTGIEELVGDPFVDTTHSNASSDKPIYDLQGRRLTTLPSRGFYIQSGRKFIIK